ncbi:MAG: hypothetical protein PHX74_00165 [Candidatus Sumerlaeales bacterium]|nr:hypothetical protein [Candidatus Sumerlaeales bacterium]
MELVHPHICIASILGRLDYWVDVPAVSYACSGVQTVPDVLPIRIEFENSEFFKADKLMSPAAPYPAETLLETATVEGFRKFVEIVSPGRVRVHFDLPACAWWFLSRHEESRIEKRDSHGRFLCSYSTLPPELYDQPLVTRWFERVEDLVRKISGLPVRAPMVGTAPIAVTHDVDLLRKFPLFSPRCLVRSYREGRLGECLKVWFRRQKDPYDALDALTHLHDETGIPGTWFLMGGGTHPSDADYNLSDHRLAPLGTRLDCDTFGLHSSYDSYLDAKKIYHEAVSLAEALKQRVKPIIRQHYLRLDIPNTWLAQSEAGFTVDASGGFADRCGFRHGWTGAFRPYSPLTGRELPMTEIPLNAMDMTLSRYERLDPESAYKRMQTLHANSLSRHGGVFTILWHNTLNDRVVHGDMYDVFDSFVRNTSARFVKLDTI